ncbi:TldD/PmbA family protein [Leucothrix sargassi]|nr:TldD/PmbA family protein [Leucothrix sargassi]
MGQSISNELLTASSQVFDRARAVGAEADLIVSEGESLSLQALDGELDKHTVSSTQSFGVRVIKDDKVGIAYSEASDEESLSWMVDQALQNATYSKAEPHEKILDSQQHLSSDDSIFYLEDDATVDQQIEMVLQLEKGLLAKKLIKNVPYNGLGQGTSNRYLFSSAGLQAASRARSVSAYAYALAEDGEKNSMEGIGQVERLTSSLNIEKLIEEAANLSIDLLDGKPVASGKYDVIFDNESQIQLFGVFTMVFSGKAAKEGINPWGDKVGQQVTDSRLQIIDCPLRVDGFGYSLFDDEGTATVDTPFVTDGVLQTFMHNSVTASHFGLKTTGHASRGTKSTLGVGYHQLTIGLGDASDAELKAGEYLEITSMAGLHSGANPISGDFSFGASGFLCRDGVRVQPVRGITVAGNFYKMLNQIQCIGDSAHWDWQRSSLMPSLRFADLAISGD